MWSRSCKVPRSCLLPFLGVFLFIIQLGLSLGDLPSIRLMQDIVCKRHYGITNDELLLEEECRGEEVQQELNTIVMGILISVIVSSESFKLNFEQDYNRGTGALVAFPLGILADRVGRVPILSLSILSMLLSQAYGMVICWQWKKIPVEALWGLGVPLLLGGGRSVAEAMVFAIIADVVPDKKRYIASRLVKDWLLTVSQGRMVSVDSRGCTFGATPWASIGGCSRSTLNMATALDITRLDHPRRRHSRCLYARDAEEGTDSGHLQLGLEQPCFTQCIQPKVAKRELFCLGNAQIHLQEADGLALARRCFDNSPRDYTIRYFYPSDAYPVRLAPGPVYTPHLFTESGHALHALCVTTSRLLPLDQAVENNIPSPARSHLRSRKFTPLPRWEYMHDDGI